MTPSQNWFSRHSSMPLLLPLLLGIAAAASSIAAAAAAAALIVPICCAAPHARAKKNAKCARARFVSCRAHTTQYQADWASVSATARNYDKKLSHRIDHNACVNVIWVFFAVTKK
jgi:hypothetical protein